MQSWNLLGVLPVGTNTSKPQKHHKPNARQNLKPKPVVTTIQTQRQPGKTDLYQTQAYFSTSFTPTGKTGKSGHPNQLSRQNGFTLLPVS
jgi:hypothetical protein